MNHILLIMASSEPAGGGIFETLGIDWLTLGLQVVAFLVLLWFLGKFVYPPLLRMLDKRDEAIEASTRAVAEAEKRAENTEKEVSRLLSEAKREAAEIVTTARDEATAALDAATEKAKARSERIVADAHDQIDKDIQAAKKALLDETLDLVAAATEKVLGQVVDKKIDDSVIATAVERAR